MHVCTYVLIIIGVCVCRHTSIFIDMVSIGWSISPSLRCFRRSESSAEAQEARSAALFWWEGLENRVPKNPTDLCLISNRDLISKISNFSIIFHHEKDNLPANFHFRAKVLSYVKSLAILICHSQDCSFSAIKTPDCTLFLKPLQHPSLVHGVHGAFEEPSRNTSVFFPTYCFFWGVGGGDRGGT